MRQNIKRTTVAALLFAIFYISSLFLHPQMQKPTAQVLSAQSNLALYEEPNDGRTFLLTALATAKQSIEVEIYLFSDKQIITALEQAQSRGVKVNVMLEQHPFGGGVVNPKTKAVLQQANIAVEWSNPAFALTHEKDIIIDHHELFVLSQNLSESSFSKNREYDIADENQQDVQEAEQIFHADWQRQSFSPVDSHLLVSPLNSRDGLTALLQKATKTIAIEIEDINDQAIIHLLSDKAKSLQVKLIAPTLAQVSSNQQALKQLQQAGVQIRILSSPYIHAKLIVIDDHQAYTGSINLSTQSMDKNRELGIVLSQADLVQNLSTTFAVDWQNAQAF